MNRVIFVDDDENVLSGLKVMLHPMRTTWTMTFALGGSQALEIMAAEELPFDVVVTDMHMPGMHGDEFLKKVAELYPQMVRFVLSGNLEPESLARAGGIAHQIVAKPCESHHLRALITRAFGLDRRLQSSSLKETLFEMCGLPSVPLVYWDLQNEMNSPEPSIDRVGQIIAKDPSMSAKVLQIAHSAHGGGARRISSITDAVAMLGVDNIRSFILMAGIFSTAEQSKMPGGFSLERLWEHGMKVGEFAKRIAECEVEEKHIIDDSYTAGLLHDVGLLILATKMPETLSQVITMSAEQHISILKAEDEVFGATHAEIGGFLLDLWGLPETIVEAISYHLYPSSKPEHAYSSTTEEESSFQPITAIHVANYLCEDQDNVLDEQSKAQIDTVHLDTLDLSTHLNTWWDTCFAGE